MNVPEARQVLTAVLEEFRQKSFEELRTMIGSPHSQRRAAASGTNYQVELQVLWDAKLGGNIRVLASADEGGLRAWVLPPSADFIIAPDGSFVGE